MFVFPFAKEEDKHLNCQSRHSEIKRKAQVEWPGLSFRWELVPPLITAIFKRQGSEKGYDFIWRAESSKGNKDFSLNSSSGRF
jgi:hypothetical protein